MADTHDSNFDVQLLTVEQLVSRLKESFETKRSELEASIYVEEIIRRFEPLLRRAWIRVSFAIEYQDFLQDVFVRLFKGLPGLIEPKAFPGYFRRVAMSVAIDYSEKYYAMRKLQRTDKIESLITRIDDEILASIFVQSYLEHLPVRDKEILYLEFIENRTQREIAAQMGLKPGALRMARSRALNRLRQLLLEQAKVLEGGSAKADEA